MKIYTLEIANWDKYNPRSDVKSSSWFRMDNDFFLDPDFYGTTLGLKFTWLIILSTASKKVSGLIKINSKQIADALSVPDSEIEECITQISRISSAEGRPILVIHHILEPENQRKINTIESGTYPIESDRENTSLLIDPNKISTIGSDRTSQCFRPLRTDGRTDETDVTDDTCTELGKADSMPVVVELKSKQSKNGAIPELAKTQEAMAMLRDVSKETQTLWLKKYENADWILSEILEMTIWITNNPRRAPKSRMGGFMSSWLGRSWESARKRPPRLNVKPEHRTQNGISNDKLQRAKELGII